MASRLIVEKVPLKTLQKYHHSWLNTFSDQETFVDAVANRPGFFGPNPVAFLSLMARRPSLELRDLEEALINDRNLIRACAFRGSLFLINSQDYPIYFRCFYNFLSQRGMKKLLEEDITQAHINLYKNLVTEAQPEFPLTVSQIIDILFAGRTERPPAETCQRIIQKLCDLGVLVRAGAKGWKSNDFTYALLTKWLPDTPMRPDSPDTARTETIRKYLRAYGPATIEDISWWTGLPIIQCQRSIGHLRREAVRFHIDGYKEDLIGLKEMVEHLRKPPPFEEEIQLLPPWDPYLLGWRCRKRVADKENLPLIYDSYGNAASAIVDCGRVIGLWQFRDIEINALEYHIFERYADRKKVVRQKIDDWMDRITKLTHSFSTKIIERNPSGPLHEQPAGSFLWPLGKQQPQKSALPQNQQSPMERRTSNTFRQRYLDNEYLIRPNAIDKPMAQTLIDPREARTQK